MSIISCTHVNPATIEAIIGPLSFPSRDNIGFAPCETNTCLLNIYKYNFLPSYLYIMHSTTQIR